MPPAVKEITNALLIYYFGGQVQIENPERGYLYLGYIGGIAAIERCLQMQLVWCAKAEDYPASHTQWIKYDLPWYQINLDLYSSRVEDYITLTSETAGETLKLYTHLQTVLAPGNVKNSETVEELVGRWTMAWPESVIPGLLSLCRSYSLRPDNRLLCMLDLIAHTRIPESWATTFKEQLEACMAFLPAYAKNEREEFRKIISKLGQA